jgi:hypothetical protein
MQWLLYLYETGPSYHCIGGWVGPRASLDAVKREKSFAPATNFSWGMTQCSSMIAKEYAASVLRVKNKPSKRQAIIDLGHCIQVQNTSVLSPSDGGTQIIPHALALQPIGLSLY